MKTSNYSSEQANKLLNDLRAQYNAAVLTKKQILAYCEKKKLPRPMFLLSKERNVAWGKYSIEEAVCRAPAVKKPAKVPSKATSPAADAVAPEMAAQVVSLASKRAQNVTESFVPLKDDTYVAFGFHNDLKSILASGIFYPIYITGLSGNGKTKMVEQVCAQIKRECIRANITKQTDETDLIGSYELIDGNTIRREGPVITAMRRGAVLLLDEVDLGTELLLCLQPILEGNPYFDKKTGELIHPAEGFTVVATANTKGKGSDDGRFIGTNVMNEAFLERFGITVEQEYPSASVERKILEKNFAVLGVDDDGFIEKLVTWAEVIRKAYFDDAVDEIISTRRLVHLAKAYSVFRDRLKAVKMCLNRFDEDTKASFLDLYTKVDAEVGNPKEAIEEVKELLNNVQVELTALYGANSNINLTVSKVDHKTVVRVKSYNVSDELIITTSANSNFDLASIESQVKRVVNNHYNDYMTYHPKLGKPIGNP